MERDLVAGIDSSTQSTTVVLRRRCDGAMVGEARAPHPSTTPPKSEQDPEAWWQAFQNATEQLGDDLKRVAAISVGGQGHGLVILDEANRPLCPAKLWNDTESAPDAERLCEALAPREWAARTGCVPGPAHTVSKVAHTQRLRPDVLRSVAKIMLPADYMVYRLSGACVTERGGASGTAYFDPFKNCWATDLLELAAGQDLSRCLPRIIASDAAAGEVRTGPLAGAIVGAGTGDNMTAALCLGLLPGDVVISLGTSGTVYALTPTPVRDPTGDIDGYADATGHFLPMVTTLNAAKVTDTMRRILGVDEAAFDALALAPSPHGSVGLSLLPYFDGERTPNLPDARGILFGLTNEVSREAIARAAVDGVLCGLLEGRDALARHGVSLDGRLLVTGGAARSKAYRQRLADLSGCAVHVSAAVEAAAGGACVQAEAAFAGRSTHAVAEVFAPGVTIVAEPDSRQADEAAEIRAIYRNLSTFAQS